MESKNTRIYRRYKEVGCCFRLHCRRLHRCLHLPLPQESGLYEYKIVGLMEDLDPELSAQVYVDWEYRKVWDSYVMGELWGRQAGMRVYKVWASWVSYGGGKRVDKVWDSYVMGELCGRLAWWRVSWVSCEAG